MPEDIDLTEEDIDEVVEMIKYDRLCSEFCGFCLTRHHPDIECIDVDLD